MLIVSFAQIACSIAATYYGSRTAMSSGRDLRAAIFRRVSDFSGREVAHFGAPSLITRNTNDVQQVQTLVAVTCTMMVTAPIMCVGGIIMALHEDVGPVVADGRQRSASRDRHRPHHPAHGAAVPADANPPRRRQPDPARADRRHPRRAGIRPRAGRDAALRHRERRIDRHRTAGRAADGAGVPVRHPATQRLERRRDVVRRDRASTPDRCRSARSRRSWST